MLGVSVPAGCTLDAEGLTGHIKTEITSNGHKTDIPLVGQHITKGVGDAVIASGIATINNTGSAQKYTMSVALDVGEKMVKMTCPYSFTAWKWSDRIYIRAARAPDETHFPYSIGFKEGHAEKQPDRSVDVEEMVTISNIAQPGRKKLVSGADLSHVTVNKDAPIQLTGTKGASGTVSYDKSTGDIYWNSWQSMPVDTYTGTANVILQPN
ncbi:hypothetical protein [Serratia sp. 1D1416]|uniref:hypothetical protein n=1 Tax=Serratia sp. 1D1416 TaxID=2447890 RepID=UPI001013CBE8|nr:hypothetical protein [Serratia sp. 1D1416]